MNLLQEFDRANVKINRVIRKPSIFTMKNIRLVLINKTLYGRSLVYSSVPPISNIEDYKYVLSIYTKSHSQIITS